MPYKKNRSVKVYEGSDRNYKPLPQIRIQGKWLEEHGFEIGTKLNIECEGGRLIITKADEVIAN